MNKMLPLFIASLILTACDVFKEKEKFTGARESYLTLDEKVTPDPTLVKTAVVLPSVEKNKDWTQVAAGPTHAMRNFALGTDLKEVFKVNVGSGGTDEHRLISNIVIGEGKAFAMDAFGKVSAVDAKTGALVWSQETAPEGKNTEGLGGGLAYDKDVVYATSSFGDVLALKAQDGKILWRTSVIAPVRIAPTVKDGRVFVSTISNELAAIDAKSGKILWSHGGIAEAASLLGGGAPAVADNVVVVTYSSGEIYAIRAENGHPLWSETLTSVIGVDSVSSIPHIVAAPVIDRDLVFTIGHGGRMAAIDLKSGVQVWQREISGISTPAVVGGFIFLIDIDGNILCLKRDTGQIHWAVPLPKTQNGGEKVIWSGPVVAGGSLVLTGTGGEILFLSPKDGKEQKKLKASSSISLPPVLADGTLYVLTDSADLIAWA